MARQKELDLDGGFPREYYTIKVEYCQYKDTFRCLIFMTINKPIAPNQGAILIRIMYRNFNERI